MGFEGELAFGGADDGLDPLAAAGEFAKPSGSFFSVGAVSGRIRCAWGPLVRKPQEAPLELPVAPALEQTVRARYEAGHSQRAIACELNIDRRKIKRILDQAA